MSCASTRNTGVGTLWGVGNNGSGQLGLGDKTPRNTLTQIGTGNNWTGIAAAWVHALARKQDGTLWAWGQNTFGEVGTGSAGEQLSQVQVGNDTHWFRLAAGHLFSLGIKSNGTLWGWGRNNQGQLRVGDTGTRFVPTQVGTGTNWITAGAGDQFALGITSDGALYMWGEVDLFERVDHFRNNPTTDFSTWITSFGLAASQQGPADDPDADGIVNFVEYLLGSNPATPSAAPPLNLRIESGNLMITYTRLKSATDVAYTPETTSNLSASWNSNGITHVKMSETAAEEIGEARIPIQNAAGFLRLRVTPL